MKVVIVDDEMLARVSLKSMLMELQFPVEIVGEGSNGEELVRLAAEFKPELAFVDIKMPKMNGLEGIKQAKAVSPHTKWIILTGFSEFDYAKEAINLGAANFLLKPLSPEELEEKLKALIIQDQERKRILNKEFENDLVALCNGLEPINQEHDQKEYSHYHFSGAIFCVDSFMDEKSKTELQIKLCREIRSLINESADYQARRALFVLKSGNLATVEAWKKTDAYGYFDKLKKLIMGMHTDSYKVTMLISEECHSTKDLYKHLKEAETAAVIRVIAGVGRVLNACALKKFMKEPKVAAFCSLLTEICAAYNVKEYYRYIKLAKDLENMLSEIYGHLDMSCWMAMEEFTTCSMNYSLNGYQDCKQWIRLLREHGEELLHSNKKDKLQNYDIVDEVKAYIEQDYVYDIGIGEIAEKMSITPNYLSALFHKKTGVTFVKYLQEVRMLKAKELLADQNVQVREAAERVGYYSARHFTKLFKDYFGTYPSQYRNMLKR